MRKIKLQNIMCEQGEQHTLLYLQLKIIELN